MVQSCLSKLSSLHVWAREINDYSTKSVTVVDTSLGAFSGVIYSHYMANINLEVRREFQREEGGNIEYSMIIIIEGKINIYRLQSITISSHKLIDFKEE